MDNGWVILILLAGIWLVVLRTRATRLDSVSEFEALTAGGVPVVAEFFTNT